MTPAWAVVLVNRSAVEGGSSLVSLAKVDVRALPDGPDSTIRGQLRGHQAALITHGMHVPVLCDPATGVAIEFMTDHLDEAIGRYYQQRDPQLYGTWEEALAARRKLHARDQLVPDFGIGNAAGAIKDAPGLVKGFFREWRKAAGEFRGGDRGRRPATVQGVHATEQSGVYELHLQVMDTPAGRPATIRAELSDARVQQLTANPYLEVTVDPANPENVSL